MTLRYDTIIFDMDGTLLDTLDDLTDAVNHALSEHGYAQHTKEAVRGFVGNGIGKLIERALPENIGKSEFETVLESFKVYYGIHCNDKTCVYEGVPELIGKLKEDGAKIAVVSNKIDSAVQELGELYFPNQVDFFIGEKDGLRRKPESDMINVVLETLNSNPESAVYVGDSEVDVQTAQNAGLKGISIAWGFRDADFLRQQGAKIVADTPEQVYEVLTGRFAKMFFRLYDRKLCSGEITFSEIGMRKDDFTRLCIDDTYVLPYEDIKRICSRMKLTDFETEYMLSFAEE